MIIKICTKPFHNVSKRNDESQVSSIHFILNTNGDLRIDIDFAGHNYA